MDINKIIIDYINKRQRKDWDAGKPGSYQVYLINWDFIFASIAFILAVIGLVYPSLVRS
jgi:hypothetical protein